MVKLFLDVKCKSYAWGKIHAHEHISWDLGKILFLDMLLKYGQKETDFFSWESFISSTWISSPPPLNLNWFTAGKASTLDFARGLNIMRQVGVEFWRMYKLGSLMFSLLFSALILAEQCVHFRVSKSVYYCGRKGCTQMPQNEPDKKPILICISFVWITVFM